MDTADRAGDAFFDLRSKVLPIECADNSSWWADDCSNQEVVASDLVITQLQLEIKGSKAFGPCARALRSNSPTRACRCAGAAAECPRVLTVTAAVGVPDSRNLR